MSAPRVTLFTRPGCHLCDEALVGIEAVASGGRSLDLEVIDIESSDELLAAHLERIPVVLVDGIEVSILEFDREAFSQAVGPPAGPSGQVA